MGYSPHSHPSSSPSIFRLFPSVRQPDAFGFSLPGKSPFHSGPLPPTRTRAGEERKLAFCKPASHVRLPLDALCVNIHHCRDHYAPTATDFSYYVVVRSLLRTAKICWTGSHEARTLLLALPGTADGGH